MYRAVDGAGACVDWPIARSSLSSSDPPPSLLILEPIGDTKKKKVFPDASISRHIEFSEKKFKRKKEEKEKKD